MGVRGCAQVDPGVCTGVQRYAYSLEMFFFLSVRRFTKIKDAGFHWCVRVWVGLCRCAQMWSDIFGVCAGSSVVFFVYMFNTFGLLVTFEAIFCSNNI